MDTNFNLEIDIQKFEDGFKASTHLFPKCEGIGKSEDAALKNLSVNISEFIRNFANETFDRILASDNFTEVILDSNKEDKKEQRIYSLDPELLNFKRGFTLKIKPDPSISKMFEPSKEDIFNLFQQKENFLAPNSNSTIVAMVGRNTPLANSDGIVFGIPISFN